MIIGELGDIKSFDSHKQLNAYVGIDIKRYQSVKHILKIKLTNVETNMLDHYFT
nr:MULTISPECIES: transposase [unclassified Mammaliicoccus]